MLNLKNSDHYWPMDTVPVYYGDIKVTLLNDSHYPDWVITEFMIQRVCRIYRNFFLLIFFENFRAKLNALYDTSTLQRGPILVFRIHHKHSYDSCVRSVNA